MSLAAPALRYNPLAPPPTLPSPAYITASAYLRPPSPQDRKRAPWTMRLGFGDDSAPNALVAPKDGDRKKLERGAAAWRGAWRRMLAPLHPLRVDIEVADLRHGTNREGSAVTSSFRDLTAVMANALWAREVRSRDDQGRTLVNLSIRLIPSPVAFRSASVSVGWGIAQTDQELFHLVQAPCRRLVEKNTAWFTGTAAIEIVAYLEEPTAHQRAAALRAALRLQR